jgi:hypothetical protein
MTTNTLTELRIYNLNYSTRSTCKSYIIAPEKTLSFYNYSLGRTLEHRYDRRRLIRQCQTLPFEDFKKTFTKLIKLEDFLNDHNLDFENQQLILHPTYTSPDIDNVIPLIFQNKLNHIDTIDGVPVLSKHSSTFYKKFNYITFQEDYDFMSLVDYFETSSSFNKFYSKKNFIHNLADISFTPIEKNPESTLNSYPVIEMKAPCSGKNVDLSLTKFTKAKYIKGDSCFVPVLLPIKSYDFVSNSFYDAYMFTFNIDVNKSKIIKYSKIRNYIHTFIEKSYDHSSLYFVDKEKYAKLNGLKLFLLNKDVEISQPISSLLQDNLDLKDPKPADVVLADTFLSTAKQIDYPLNIITKEKKLQKKIKTVKTFFNTSNEELNISKIKSTISSQNHNIERYKRQIAEYENYIKSAMQGLDQAIKQRDSYLKNFHTYIDNLKINSLKGRALQKAYSSFKEEKLQIAKSLPFKKDETLSNMLKYFEIIDVVFNDNSRWTNTNDFSEESLKLNKIKEVIVATNAPNKITLVNKKESVVGGPYILKITQHGLKIKPRNKSTYIGLFQRNNVFYYYVHPHAGSRMNISEMFKEWCGACLGEASGLLYKAFEQNSLKMILLAADCWLNSANQADTWGKNYVHFTSWEDYQARIDFIQSTSEEDIGSYEEELQQYQCKDLPFQLEVSPDAVEPIEDLSQEDELQVNPEPQIVNQELEETHTSSIQNEYVPYVSNTWS